MIECYGVTCVQAETHVVTEAETRDETVRRNLDRAVELLDFVGGEVRFDTRLVVFPEFFLTGVPEDRFIESYVRNASPIPGPETDPLAEKAAEHGFFVAANTFEADPDWPGRVFNTSFIIDDGGKVILKYRKHNDAYAPVNTHPGDVYTEFVERYGEDALFPVVDTRIGRLACITCYDINFPEAARCYALKGAEVLIMPTGEGHTFVRKQHLMRRARAYENAVYVVTANHGRFYGGPRPTFQQGGYSEIINPEGDVLQSTGGPGEATVSAVIDIAALRRKRSKVDFFNFLACFRGSLYAREYLRHEAWPLDAQADKPIESNRENFDLGRRVLESLNLPGVRSLA
ncbi:MAG: nitrilase-related carbon-nitrogen hydrolase [Nitrospinota bacterium]